MIFSPFKNKDMSHRLLPFMDDIWSFLKLVMMTIIMYLSPIKSFVHLVALLIVLDMITGIVGAWKSGEKITARKMSTTVLKIILYSIAIIATYLVQQIANDGIGFVRISALIIAATELKSIYENIGKMFGGDLFGTLWQVIKGRIDGIVNAIPIVKNDKAGEQNEQAD